MIDCTLYRTQQKPTQRFFSFLLGLTHDEISRIFYSKLFWKKLEFVFFGYLFALV